MNLTIILLKIEFQFIESIESCGICVDIYVQNQEFVRNYVRERRYKYNTKSELASVTIIQIHTGTNELILVLLYFRERERKKKLSQIK